MSTGEGRADLHFHILPGVDDGPRTVEESLELARLAVADGTRCVVATPHVPEVEPESIPERVALLQREIDAARIPLRLRAGGELAPAGLDRVSEAGLDVIAQGPAGRRWILLEAPLERDGLGAFEDAAASLEARGLASVIAHPERSDALMSGGAAPLRRRLRAGDRLQVSAPSVLGTYGEAVRARAVALLAGGEAHLLASDSHSARRPPCLTSCVPAARAAGVPPRAIRAALEEAPWRLLQAGVSRTEASDRGAAGEPRRARSGSARRSANRT